MTRAGVFGAGGFVGSAVVDALRRRDVECVPLAAPRLRTSSRVAGEIVAEVETHGRTLGGLVGLMQGLDVVINAAGLALPTFPTSDALFGANALLPAFLAAAACRSGCRLVHVSSAAVQGPTKVLDESTSVHPFSPYSISKAVGEQALSGFDHTIIFRPTSVQGVDRAVTRQLVRLSSSRLASVASPGTDPTPQVLVDNVGDAIAFTALSVAEPPKVVLQPSEGLTTSGLMRVLGGRRPLLVPRPVARALVSGARKTTARSASLSGHVRRVEMLWFGQEQRQGWLTDKWKPIRGPEGWENLA